MWGWVKARYGDHKGLREQHDRAAGPSHPDPSPCRETRNSGRTRASAPHSAPDNTAQPPVHNARGLDETAKHGGHTGGGP